MSLVGADDFFFRFCSRRERVHIYLLDGVALFNCIAVGYGLAAPLVRLGETLSIAIMAGFFAGSWFACIQLFMVITHVQGRSRVRGLLSRLSCLAFLALFGLLASAGIAVGIHSNPSSSWFHVSFPILFSSFLLPWLLAPRILGGGAYYRAQQQAEAQCLSQWRRSFIPRYEDLIRKRYRDPTYQAPPGINQ